MLGLPPAFVLSQDQTLKLKSVILDGLEEVTPSDSLCNGHLHSCCESVQIAPDASTSGDGMKHRYQPESRDQSTREGISICKDSAACVSLSSINLSKSIPKTSRITQP